MEYEHAFKSKRMRLADNMIKSEQNIELMKEAFVKQLRKELSEPNFAEVIKRNAAEEDQRICHSHDFIDANAVMADAFEACFQESIDFENRIHVEIINEAWSLAKKKALS